MEDRLLKLIKKIVVDPQTGCYIWTGARTRKGYGVVIDTRSGKITTVHRLVHELVYDHKVPGGIQVCHHCDNPPCCNPEHTWQGTWKENLADAVQKGRLSEECNLVKGFLG